MQSIKLNVGKHAYTSYRIVLGQTAYDMVFRFNGRSGRWMMDLKDATNQKYLWKGLRMMPVNDNTFFTAPNFREQVGSFLTSTNFDFTNPTPISLDNFAQELVQHSFEFVDVEMMEELNK